MSTSEFVCAELKRIVCLHSSHFISKRGIGTNFFLVLGFFLFCAFVFFFNCVIYLLFLFLLLARIVFCSPLAFGKKTTLTQSKVKIIKIISFSGTK